MNLKELKELLELIKNSGVSEIEIERSGFRVRIRQERGEASRPAAAPPEAAPVELHAPAAAPQPAPEAEQRPGLVAVVSPVVGTFYRSPAPDSEHYVEVGARVRKGQVLCIIEAMKLMNEIEAECDGTVVEILVENAQPVEYGQKLFLIDPAPAAEA
jgi:acetyl-CoA carboxylase biotin carboxyl carrier protein